MSESEQEKKESTPHENVDNTDTDLDSTDSDILSILNVVNALLVNGDHERFVTLFKNAVRKGFRGDYSLIGIMYATGLGNLKANSSEAFCWLTRFYDDYVKGLLDINDTCSVVNVCYYLGTLYLWDLQSSDQPESNREQSGQFFLKYWREAVNLSVQITMHDNDDYEDIANKIMSIGCCFYYGEIHSAGHEDYHISKEYDMAFKAFTEADRMGNVQASSILGEMYDKGIFVDRDETVAPKYYRKAAISGNMEAIMWCHAYYVEQLPWNVNVNWNLIKIKNLSIRGRIYSYLQDNNIRTLYDFRQISLSSPMGDDYSLWVRTYRTVQKAMVSEINEMNLDKIVNSEDDMAELRCNYVYTVGDFINHKGNDYWMEIKPSTKARVSKTVRESIPSEIIESIRQMWSNDN